MAELARVVLDGSQVAEIGRIGLERRPSEACGILLPYPWKGRQVFELPNRAELHHDKFEMHSDDIVITLQDWVDSTPEATWDMLTVWHTHPAGNIGPSKADLEERSEHCGNLVVALTEDGPIPTWF